MRIRFFALAVLLIGLCGCAGYQKLQEMRDQVIAQAPPLPSPHGFNQETFKNCESTFFRRGIVNGRPVLENDPLAKKAILLLTRRSGKTSSCTAVALSPKVLMTAAHCVAGANPTTVTAVFETTANCPSGSEQKMTISSQSFVVHEKYNGTPQSQSDLALVKLSNPIPSDYYVASLFDGLSPLSTDEVIMLGFGITDEKKQDSMVLRTTTKSFKNDSYVKGPIIGFNQKNKTGGFCRGDSGAPIFVNSGGVYKIIGINSFNIGKGKDTECRTASVGMYAPHFKNWIITQVLSL